MDEIERLLQIGADKTREGKFNQAIEAYKKVISICDQSDQAVHLSHWGIGEIYLDNQDFEKAKYHLRKAIELAPGDAGYHYLLGCTCRYTEEIDISLYHLHKAVELDDSRDIFWCELGWVMGHFRDADKGIEYLKKALELNPTSSKALTDMAVLYASKKKWNAALLCIEEALKCDPNNQLAIDVDKKLQYFKNDFEKASEGPDILGAS